VKRQREFFAADGMAWREAQQPGTEEKVLSRDADHPAVLTRLVRWVPGLDTSGVGVITHDYVEEVYLLEGELTDLTLGRTFGAGHYASRRPRMPHGPYRTTAGCTFAQASDATLVTLDRTMPARYPSVRVELLLP
jgi:hypothetical protein